VCIVGLVWIVFLTIPGWARGSSLILNFSNLSFQYEESVIEESGRLTTSTAHYRTVDGENYLFGVYADAYADGLTYDSQLWDGTPIESKTEDILLREQVIGDFPLRRNEREFCI